MCQYRTPFSYSSAKRIMYSVFITEFVSILNPDMRMYALFFIQSLVLINIVTHASPIDVSKKNSNIENIIRCVLTISISITYCIFSIYCFIRVKMVNVGQVNIYKCEVSQVNICQIFNFAIVFLAVFYGTVNLCSCVCWTCHLGTEPSDLY